jgi:hypothetical protein
MIKYIYTLALVISFSNVIIVDTPDDISVCTVVGSPGSEIFICN